MTFLQRVLKVQAALWALFGAALGLFPRWLVVEVLDQPAMPQHVWLRASGVMAIVLAMLMVLMAQRITEVWWWAWSFVLLEAGTATLFILKGAFRVVPGTSSWAWWVLGGVNAVFAALLLLGLARASREQPIVP
jgi:hypothetical protein